jgi:hypothetical protein
MDRLSAIDQICLSIYKQLTIFQQEKPEILTDFYWNLLWHGNNESYVILSALHAHLTTIFDHPNWQLKLKQFLSKFLNPYFFESTDFYTLLNFISYLYRTNCLSGESNGSNISILLLDVENIRITSEEETFLQKYGRYPIQIKIAFGNWRNLGKHDEVYHRRGYELIHVPRGENSADIKMTATGAMLPFQFPSAKEVFVCLFF